MVRRKGNIPNSSAQINSAPTLRCICFSKLRAISGFGFFVFGIIQLERRSGGGGVFACIHGLEGKIRRVHSHGGERRGGMGLVFFWCWSWDYLFRFNDLRCFLSRKQGWIPASCGRV